MLPVRDGYRFCVCHRAARGSSQRGSILYVHPFAEELNKSRRAIAMTCRRLAAEGWNVLQIDLLGCGDSSGDFADATWPQWQDDLCSAAGWLAERGAAVSVLWGLRLGALLASSVATRIADEPDLLFWNPVSNGKTHLTQFLRLKAAEELINPGNESGGTARLRAELAADKPVHVAGYALTPALAKGMDEAELALPEGYGGRVLWFEAGSSEPASLGPASNKCVGALRSRGIRVDTRVIDAPAFWQTVEIEECPSLVQLTVDALAP